MVETKKDQILAWLSPENRNTTQQEKRNERSQDTGNWFLESEEFTSWHNFEGPNLFYCHGKGELLTEIGLTVAGSGKSVLTCVRSASLLIDRAAAIDYLYESKSSDASFENVGITYFYFKHHDRGKSNEKVAMFLLRNLVSKADDIPPLLHKMFDDDKHGKPPKFDDIVTLMISYLQCYTSIFVFFDALDESTEEQKEKALELIERLCDAGMRVFLTSQPHLKSRVEELGPLVRYEIRAQEDDLNAFVRQELVKKKFDKRFPHFPAADKEKIQTTLVESADGM